MLTKLIVISFFFMSTFSYVYSQQIDYTYDANGNRDTRVLHVSKKSSTCDSTGRNAFIPIDDNDSQSILGMEVSVFPNPVDEELFLNVVNPIGGIEYQLSDVRGNTVIKGSLLENTKIDFSQLPPGIYMLDIRAGEETLVWKILKR